MIHMGNEEEKDDILFQLRELNRPYWFFEQVLTRRVLHFYLSQVIEEPNKYIEMVHQIQTAGSDSIVYIHLNTPGGRLDTGIQLVNSMQASEAHIICSLEGEIASLGTLIFLAADEFIVHDNCLMMFHNYSGGVFGKGHEQIAALEANTRWVEEIMKRLYIPFMSEEEFERVRRGEDLYFHSDEIRKRLSKMVKIIEKEKQQAEAETVAEAEKPKTRRRSTKKTR